MRNNGKILIWPGGATLVNKYFERLLVLATKGRSVPRRRTDAHGLWLSSKADLWNSGGGAFSAVDFSASEAAQPMEPANSNGALGFTELTYRF